MTEKVSICRQDDLPMPLIAFRCPEDLAAWYRHQLDWAFSQGERELRISCFDPAAMDFSPAGTAHTVLQEVMAFLYDHPQVLRLTVCCGGEKAFQIYSLQWNMWFAAHKPRH